MEFLKDYIARAADGCHKYGWLLNLIVVAIMFAYYMGGVSSTVSDIKERVMRLEGQVYDLGYDKRTGERK